MDNKEILKHVDHTLLLQPSTWAEIRQICDDAVKYGTASVCRRHFAADPSDVLSVRPFALYPF